MYTRRAQDAARLRQSAPGRGVTAGRRRAQAGQAQVGDFDHAGDIAKQVGRLDVAVNDTLAVRIFQAPCRVQQTADRLRHRQWPLSQHQRRQVLAVDEFHDQEMALGILVGIIGHDDVGVTEPGDGLDLALEPLDEGRVLPETGGQQLESDDAFHAAVPGFVNRAHAAGAQPAEHVVIADPQLLRLALTHRIHLVSRRQSSTYQGARQGHAIRGGVGLCHPVQLAWRHKITGFHDLQEFLPADVPGHTDRLRSLPGCSRKHEGRRFKVESRISLRNTSFVLEDYSRSYRVTTVNENLSILPFCRADSDQVCRQPRIGPRMSPINVTA